MATDAQVLSAIAAVQALQNQGFNELAMVGIIDRAIADALLNQSGTVSFPYKSQGSDSVMYTQMDLEQAYALRNYYREEVRKINPVPALMPEFPGPFGGTNQDTAIASY